MLILTRELIEAGKSKNGGYGRKQVAVLGADCTKRGWMRCLIGKEVNAETYQTYLEMKDGHVKPKTLPADDKWESVSTCKALLFFNIDDTWKRSFVEEGREFHCAEYSKLIMWIECHSIRGLFEGSWSIISHRSKVKTRIVKRLRELLMRDGKLMERYV